MTRVTNFVSLWHHFCCVFADVTGRIYRANTPSFFPGLSHLFWSKIDNWNSFPVNPRGGRTVRRGRPCILTDESRCHVTAEIVGPDSASSGRLSRWIINFSLGRAWKDSAFYLARSLSHFPLFTLVLCFRSDLLVLSFPSAASILSVFVCPVRDVYLIFRNTRGKNDPCTSVRASEKRERMRKQAQVPFIRYYNGWVNLVILLRKSGISESRQSFYLHRNSPNDCSINF